MYFDTNIHTQMHAYTWTFTIKLEPTYVIMCKEDVGFLTRISHSNGIKMEIFRFIGPINQEFEGTKN